jgi:hypothetical protein
MHGSYVGYVAGHDPLHEFLSRILRDRLGVEEPRPAFRSFRLSGSNEVYAYQEGSSGARVICKFYGTRFGWDRDKAAWMARQEYEGLKTLRHYNLVGSSSGCGPATASGRRRSTSSPGCATAGGTGPGCGRTGRSGCTATPPRRTSCSATAWTWPRSLERMKRGDRMFDVGRVAGELQHAFLRTVGDWRRAEPFIGHFLWEYSSHFPDRERTFESITERAPYYMALNLLRIARNDYLGRDYSGRLVGRARKLLRAA